MDDDRCRAQVVQIRADRIACMCRRLHVNGPPLHPGHRFQELEDFRDASQLKCVHAERLGADCMNGLLSRATEKEVRSLRKVGSMDRMPQRSNDQLAQLSAQRRNPLPRPESQISGERSVRPDKKSWRTSLSRSLIILAKKSMNLRQMGKIFQSCLPSCAEKARAMASY